jgi:hypothetical protein
MFQNKTPWDTRSHFSDRLEELSGTDLKAFRYLSLVILVVGHDKIKESKDLAPFIPSC